MNEILLFRDFIIIAFASIIVSFLYYIIALLVLRREKDKALQVSTIGAALYIIFYFLNRDSIVYAINADNFVLNCILYSTVSSVSFSVITLIIYLVWQKLIDSILTK